ncbi:MAG: ACP phosphodiesterase [Salibacteraceae bacterium]
MSKALSICYIRRVNYLAHLYLSGNSEELLIGNFIGDAVKGNDLSNYSPEIQEGIRLHRSIDAYTDQHPMALRSKKRLQPMLRKYAGVVADIFYDYILARHWSRYHEESLRKYVDRVYAILQHREQDMPYRAQRFLSYLLHYDMLYHYQSAQGIDRVLKGMAQRARFESGMENAVQLLPEHLEGLESDFFEFFPDLEHHVRQHLERS